jgi:cytochrome c-type biogenesis protein CcmH/NrfF
MIRRRSGNAFACLQAVVAAALLSAGLCAGVHAQEQPVTSSVSNLNAEQAARAEALGKKLKCMCGGCEEAAAMCTHSGGDYAGPCDNAKAELAEINQMVARGDSDDQVLQNFVKEYGPTVLIEPPKQGFSLLAWVMPVALPLIAILLVWGVVQRWREKNQLAPAGGPAIDPALLARAHHESGASDE